MDPSFIPQEAQNPGGFKLQDVITEVLTLPHEQTRKIIKIGNSLAITIPKPWLRYYKLDEKDYLKIISNSSITIEPQKKKKDTQDDSEN